MGKIWKHDSLERRVKDIQEVQQQNVWQFIFDGLERHALQF